MVFEYIKDNGFIKPVQITALKKYPNISNANQMSVISIMNDALPKKNTEAKVSFSEKKLDKYFPSHYSAKDRETVIYNYWNSGVKHRKQFNKREQDSRSVKRALLEQEER